MRIDKYSGMQLSQRFEKTAKEKAKLLEKLATGKAVNRASDDPAGLSMAMEFEKQVRAFRNAGENIAAGVSALSIADGNAQSINDLLQRQRDLAMESSNGTLNSDQRQVIDKEFQSLSQEIDRISKSAQFNGQNLLDGSSKLSDGTGKVQAGSNPNEAVPLPGSDLSLSGLNLGGQSVSSAASALKAMNAIDSAMNKVNDNRATQGSIQNRLSFALENIDNTMINTVKGLSSIEDLDYAKATTDLVRATILQDSNAAALGQFNNLSKNNLMALLQ